MGNNDCRIFNDYDDKEIVTGKGVYSFKKSHRATNESEKIFYGKEEKVYDQVKEKIDRTVSLVRQGATEYGNGNVLVIKPC
jgi:hypothetical protein